MPDPANDPNQQLVLDLIHQNGGLWLLGGAKLSLNQPAPIVSLTPSYLTPIFNILPSVMTKIPSQPSPMFSGKTPPTPSGPPLPSPEPKVGELGDLLKAIMEVPSIKATRSILEERAKGEMARVWKGLKADPKSFVMLGPMIISTLATGVVAAHQLNFNIPKLPKIPFGKGISLQLNYVNSSRAALNQPLEPRSFGAELSVDLAEFFPKVFK